MIFSLVYGPRPMQPRLIAPFEDDLRARVTAWPDLSGKRLLRELTGRGYHGCHSVVTDFLRTARPPRTKMFERRFETAAGKQAQVDLAQFRVEFTDEPGATRADAARVEKPSRKPPVGHSSTESDMWPLTGWRTVPDRWPAAETPSCA